MRTRLGNDELERAGARWRCDREPIISPDRAKDFAAALNEWWLRRNRMFPNLLPCAGSRHRLPWPPGPKSEGPVEKKRRRLGVQADRHKARHVDLNEAALAKHAR